MREDQDTVKAMRSSGIPLSYWDFGDEKEDPIHRIHSYPAKFPAFITTKALRYAEQEDIKVQMVADVFCGCGTTAVEAKRNGKEFWGCDINPVATLIARVKTHHYRDQVLLRYFSSIKDEFFHTDPTENDYERITDRIQYWFDEHNIEDLIRLDRAIRCKTPAGSPHRRFFLCGFSNILKSTSRWLTKSIKAQLDPEKSPRGVMEAFEDQFALMRKANEQNLFPVPSTKVHIRRQNFLASSKTENQPDLIVTSPPYVTSYDYASIHQLSTLWLRYASDYRSLQKNMLGNRYFVEEPDPVGLAQLGPSSVETYHALLSIERCKANSVARYFLDIDKAVAKCGRMLNERGMAVFVIGNTQYRNVKIDNAKHLENCMVRTGFRSVKSIPRKVSLKTMTPYRDIHGRFTRDSTQRKVYSEEFVVIGRKR